MATLKTLEIDTVKIRSLQVAAKDNIYIPSNYELYSKGDGTTYWSTGVTGAQFLNLSTTVSTNFTDVNNSISSLTKELFSTLIGFSTFAYNLSTYEITLKYTDDQISKLSDDLTSYIAGTYETKQRVDALDTVLRRDLNIFNTNLNNRVSTLSTLLDRVEFRLENQSTFIQSSVLGPLTAYTSSTFTGIFEIENTNKRLFQHALINNAIYLEGNILKISSVVGDRLSILENANFATAIQSTATVLNNNIKNEALSTYLSSVSYTDLQNSILYKEIINNEAAIGNLRNNLTDSAYGINSNIKNISTNIGTAFSTLISTQTSTNTFMLDNLSNIINTGVTKQIYTTFRELESYSAKTVESAIYNLSTTLSTTLSSYTTYTESTIVAVSRSTFNYFTRNIYLSTLSTVSPMINRSLYSTISSVVVNFANDVRNLNSTNIGIVSTYTLGNKVSTASLVSMGVSTMSTILYSQYLTAPSIIMNSFDNISTLENIFVADGTSTVKAGIVNLDLTQYNNFYLLVSDISSDVFYGLTYSTSQYQMSKDISLQIDITSSYTNKYTTIDTSNLSLWLGKPTIYNQGPTTLFEKAFPQIYLSTFLGAHIIQMRLNMNKLYIRDIITIPYIYTTMSLNNIELLSNLSVSDPRLQYSTFVYSGTNMPVSWKTNDLNVEVGLKFEGYDISGNKIERWAGPYNSSDKIATVIVPECTPLAYYTNIYLGVYPPKGFLIAPASGNINSKNHMFDSIVLDKPINVYTPTINSKITVYNPGNVEKILEIGELQIINNEGTNIVGKNINDYVNIVSTSSRPYQGDYVSWKISNMFDGSPTTAFRAGRDIHVIDKNAYVSIDLSSKNKGSMTSGSQILSTLTIFGSANNDSLYSIKGMKLKIENKHVPGIADGLFFKEVELTNYTPNVVALR